MGQPAEQSRDDFKDVQEVEVLSYQNSRRNSAEKHFSECLHLKLINIMKIEKQTFKSTLTEITILIKTLAKNYLKTETQFQNEFH